MKKKASIRDVANKAGVSVSTVSAVINNKVGENIRVGEETQNKIREAIDTLGFIPNLAARNLVSGRSHIVSVFTYEAVFPFAGENEFYFFLLGIERQAEISGYDILLITNRKLLAGERRGNEGDLNRLKMGDGGILIGIKRDTETLIRLIDEGFPIVFIGRRDIGGRPLNMVNYDYAYIIKKLIEMSCSWGHRNSVYFRLDGNQEPYLDRQTALDSAVGDCDEFKVETVIVTLDHLSIDQIKRYQDAGVTLFIAERHSIADRLESICKAGGLKPGKDISIILLEDQWFSSSIKWTSWSDVRTNLGMEALNLLDELLSGKTKTPTIRLIKPEVIPGETLKWMK